MSVVKFLQFHFWGKGRLDRLQFFFLSFVLGVILFTLMIAHAVHATEDPSSESVVYAMLIGMGVLVIWSGFAHAIKRLHDMNLSGWWLLPVVGLKVIIGIILPPLETAAEAVTEFIVFACLCLIKGTTGINRFGIDPRTHSPSKLFLGQVAWTYER